MNINSKLMKLEEVTGFPVAPDLYRGESDKWIVFTYTDERGELYADDSEQYVTVKLYVSFYCPESYNYMADKKKIKKALIDEGFQIESISSYIDNSGIEGTDYIRRVLFEINYTNIDN